MLFPLDVPDHPPTTSEGGLPPGARLGLTWVIESHPAIDPGRIGVAGHSYERVVAAGYLGVGELASDRVLLHTLAWWLMQSEGSLPTRNVALLRAVLLQVGGGRVDVEGQGWAASLYPGALRAIEPDLVGRVIVDGVPNDELGYLRKAGRVPDLLLHPSLFLRVTAAELAD